MSFTRFNEKKTNHQLPPSGNREETQKINKKKKKRRLKIKINILWTCILIRKPSFVFDLIILVKFREMICGYSFT